MVAKTPEESRIVGNFGEYVLAFYLAKKGINVIRADTHFFDLIVKDTSGRVFKKNDIIGISVKFRDRTLTTSTCTIPYKEFESVVKFGKKWKFEPYFCHIIVSREEDQGILEGFIFSRKSAKKYFAKRKRQHAISFSKLRADRSLTQSNRYFKWNLGKIH